VKVVQEERIQASPSTLPTALPIGGLVIGIDDFRIIGACPCMTWEDDWDLVDNVHQMPVLPRVGSSKRPMD
jgi:hypothetical protein